MYTYVAKYKYGHMCNRCMTLSTSTYIHVCTYTCTHMLLSISMVICAIDV